jgi:hypothetical protein
MCSSAQQGLLVPPLQVTSQEEKSGVRALCTAEGRRQRQYLLSAARLPPTLVPSNLDDRQGAARREVAKPPQTANAGLNNEEPVPTVVRIPHICIGAPD